MKSHKSDDERHENCDFETSIEEKLPHDTNRLRSAEQLGTTEH